MGKYIYPLNNHHAKSKQYPLEESSMRSNSYTKSKLVYFYLHAFEGVLEELHQDNTLDLTFLEHALCMEAFPLIALPYQVSF